MGGHFFLSAPERRGAAREAGERREGARDIMNSPPDSNKYGCRCKASIVKRRGQVIYELVREPDV